MNSNLHPIFRQALAPFMNLPMLSETVCRQCNSRFGPGRHHFVHCSEHKTLDWHKANDAAALALQIKDQS